MSDRKNEKPLKISQVPEGFIADEEGKEVGVQLPIPIESMGALGIVGITHSPPTKKWLCGLSVSLESNMIRDRVSAQPKGMYAIVPLTKTQVRQLADALYQVLADS